MDYRNHIILPRIRSYRFGFNGKEKLNEQYGEGNAYDFGARIYDPRIGRWLAVDPMSRKQPGWSPYKFGLDNPIIYNDPDGNDDFLTVNVTDQKTGHTVSITYVRSNDVFYGGRAQPNNTVGSRGNALYYDRQTTLNLTRGEDGSLNFVSAETNLIKNGPNSVKFQSLLRADWLPNTDFSISGKGGFQKGGLYMTSKSGGADPTKFKPLTDVGKEIKDIDGLINALGGLAGDKQFNKYDPDKNFKKMVDTFKRKFDSLKQENNTGDNYHNTKGSDNDKNADDYLKGTYDTEKSSEDRNDGYKDKKKGEYYYTDPPTSNE